MYVIYLRNLIDTKKAIKPVFYYFYLLAMYIASFTTLLASYIAS